MASKFKRSGSPYWYLKYRDETGTIVRKATEYRVGVGVDTRACERYVAQLTLQEKDRGLISRARHAFDHWVPGFLQSTYSNSPETLLKYQTCWRAVSLWRKQAGIASPYQVQRHHAGEYVVWRTSKKFRKGIVSRNTAIFDLRVLRLVMYEALNRGYVTANPISRLRFKADRVREKPALTPEQIEVVRRELKNWPEWMRTSFEIALHQGCRLRETSVPLSDIDVQGGTITFLIKRGKRHTTKLHPALVPLMQSLAGQELTCNLPGNPSKEWGKLFRKAGMRGYTFHCLRVTAITQLARAGVSEGAAMRFIGHASAAIHRIYQRLGVGDLGSCVDALRFE